MKKCCFILFFGIHAVLAQQTGNYPLAGALPDVAEMEKLSRQHLVQARELGEDAFTNASAYFDIHYYQCNWQLNPEVNYLKGAITAHFTMKAAADSIVFDLAATLTVDSVIYHTQKLSFQQTASNTLVLQWPIALPAGKKDSVTIYYQGAPSSYGLGEWYQGFHRGSYAVWTLSEPYGAAGWWPCKNGLTDKADSIDITITVPQLYTAVSNGVLISRETIGGNTTSHFHHRYPVATYLIAMAVTQYATEKDSVLLGNRQMPVYMHSFTFDVDYYKPATARVKDCLLYFSDLFGIYPFYKEQYAQTQWGLGAGMEHQTNSFIPDRWPNLLAHELGHQWFGDKVTCGSWQDLWLNEGFATYTEWLYYEKFDPSNFNAGIASHIKTITSIADGSVWVNDTANFSRLFSSRLTYKKGGMAVRMLRWVLGDSVFYQGIRAYLEDPAVEYGFARTADLKRVLEAQSGKDLTNFFNKWIYGEGFPSYQLSWKQNTGNWITMKLNQTTSHPSVGFYDMPVAIQFKNTTRDTTIIFDHEFSGQQRSVQIGFQADTAIIDPQYWLISRNNTSVKENTAATPNLIRIYPNPAVADLAVSLQNPAGKKISLLLFNGAGQLLYRKEQSLSGQDELFTIPFRHYAAGVYYLRVEGDGGIRLTRKIMH